MSTDFGWIESPKEVERVCESLPTPFMTSEIAPDAKGDTNALLYKFVRKIIGTDAPKGPQKIGDCVSWGWGNLVNYVMCLQIFKALKLANLLTVPDRALMTAGEHKALLLQRDQIVGQYEETATESIYALSRVEIGGQRGSYSDGSVGAWAAKAVSTKGLLSRDYLQKAGLGGAYNPQRAKDWGAKGLPDNLEPDALKHTVKTVSMVTSVDQAIALIQNGYPVAICSNQGFNTTRDQQGFCRPQGIWNHCMLLVGYRSDRPGFCTSQSWGANSPSGPLDLEQPDNTFWQDAEVTERILRQRDSFTGSEFVDYPNQDLISWSH